MGRRIDGILRGNLAQARPLAESLTEAPDRSQLWALIATAGAEPQLSDSVLAALLALDQESTDWRVALCLAEVHTYGGRPDTAFE